MGLGSYHRVLSLVQNMQTLGQLFEPLYEREANLDDEEDDEDEDPEGIGVSVEDSDDENEGRGISGVGRVKTGKW